MQIARKPGHVWMWADERYSEDEQTERMIENPPNYIFTTDEANAFVMEMLRGPMGPVGPMGMTGASGG